jgi:hypothetical protein
VFVVGAPRFSRCGILASQAPGVAGASQRMAGSHALPPTQVNFPQRLGRPPKEHPCGTTWRPARLNMDATKTVRTRAA